MGTASSLRDRAGLRSQPDVRGDAAIAHLSAIAAGGRTMRWCERACANLSPFAGRCIPTVLALSVTILAGGPRAMMRVARRPGGMVIGALVPKARYGADQHGDPALVPRAREPLVIWKNDCNIVRPHSALGNLPPTPSPLLE